MHEDADAATVVARCGVCALVRAALAPEARTDALLRAWMSRRATRDLGARLRWLLERLYLAPACVEMSAIDDGDGNHVPLELHIFPGAPEMAISIPALPEPARKVAQYLALRWQACFRMLRTFSVGRRAVLTENLFDADADRCIDRFALFARTACLALYDERARGECAFLRAWDRVRLAVTLFLFVHPEAVPAADVARLAGLLRRRIPHIVDRWAPSRAFLPPDAPRGPVAAKVRKRE